jgi:hypothetical protein
MLPVVRPATLLLTASVVATLLTALSVGIRLAALDEHTTLFVEQPPSALAVAYRLFSTDDEGNVPTWFSAVLLVAIALVSSGIGVLLRARGGPLRWYWFGLAAVFAYLSVDELAMVHEELISQLEDLAAVGGALTFPWVVVAAPLVVVFVLVYTRFLWRLPRHIAVLLVAAGVLYVGGALVLEIVGAPYVGYNVTYVVLTSAEEWLEMVGAALCLYAAARYADELTRPAGGGIPEMPGSSSAAGRRPEHREGVGDLELR